MVGFKSHH